MANTTILNLPVAVTLDGTEPVEIVQPPNSTAGVSKRATTGQIAQLATLGGNPSGYPFIIATPNSYLASSRVLAVNSDLQLTDGGAGGSMTIGPISTGAVSYAKFQQTPPQTLLANGAATTGNIGSVTLGGAFTLNTSTLVIATNAIDNTLIRQSGPLSVIGRSANSTGNVADISGTAGQYLQVNSSGTALSFAALPSSRTVLTSARTYYVNSSTGSNANSGLTTGTAFATIQFAVNTILNNIDRGGQTVTISALGTFNEDVAISSSWTGSGSTVLDGGSSTSTSLNGTTIALLAENDAILTYQNIKITSAAYGIVIRMGGVLYQGAGVDIGSCPNVQISAASNGAWQPNADWTLSGGANAATGSFLDVSHNAECRNVGFKPTFTANATYGRAFVSCRGDSDLVWQAPAPVNGTYTITGARYYIDGNANIYGGAAGTLGESFFPGTSSGTIVGGGIYDNVAGQVPGATSNTSAMAGRVGEYISATTDIASRISLTSNTAANVASILLTPGDWDVQGNVGYAAGTTTVTTFALSTINTTSGTLPTSPDSGARNAWAGSVTGNTLPCLPTGNTRVNTSANVTAYLLAFATFTTSTASAFGFIGARRAR